MKHLAAFLLLGLGGNTSPSAKDVKAVLESVGIEADDERLNKLISELEGKDINEVRYDFGIATDAKDVDANKVHSSSLRAPASLPPFPLVALVVPPLLPAVLLPVVPLRTPPRRRRRRRRRSPTRTWDSVSSTKYPSHALASSKNIRSNRPTFSQVIDMGKSLLGWASAHVCVGTPARFGQIKSSLVL